LPGTDLALSRIGFGSWPLGGGPWGAVDEADARGAIHAALDLGIDWFDTAPLYGHGAADALLVRILGARIRDVSIATKVGVRFDAATDHAESDLSPAHVRADCEASLTRLGLERIDLLQVHWPCEQGTPLDETLGALSALRDEGLIRAFGLCNYDAAGLETALALAPIASLQSPLSLIRREAEDGLLPLALSRGLSFLAYETLGRGLLTGKYRGLPHFADTDLRARDPRFRGSRFLSIAALAQTLRAIGDRINANAAAVAVGWVLSRPGVTHAIVGARNAAQIRESALAPRLSAEPALWPKLERALYPS
jgi:aryl-alcohol dehydrogenase-like predicted oxidoreductase